MSALALVEDPEAVAMPPRAASGANVILAVLDHGDNEIAELNAKITEYRAKADKLEERMSYVRQLVEIARKYQTLVEENR